MRDNTCAEHSYTTNIFRTLFSKQMKALKIDGSRPLIFYGAGAYAPYIRNVLMEIGIEPTCFSDKDESKHGSFCCGKVILPLAEAVKKYPDFLLFITTKESSWKDIAEELISSKLVSENQILNWKLSSYKTCRALEEDLISYDSTSDSYLSSCCMWEIENKPYFKIGLEDYDDIVSRYFEFRDHVIEDLNSPSPQYCLNCPKIEERTGVSLLKPAIHALHFGEHGICNFECCYCGEKREAHWLKRKGVNYSLLLQNLEKQGRMDEYTRIFISVGEITMHPQCDELLSLAGKYKTTICTNASIFNEKIADMMKSADTCLHVSMDAGTKETFREVKGRNAFDKVCENLRKYSNGNGGIELKYILLTDINDNLQDADGFLSLCSEINVSKVTLSKDWNVRQLPKKTVSIGEYILSKAQELGFETELAAFLTQDEISSIILSTH